MMEMMLSGTRTRMGRIGVEVLGKICLYHSCCSIFNPAQCVEINLSKRQLYIMRLYIGLKSLPGKFDPREEKWSVKLMGGQWLSSLAQKN